MQNKFSAKTKEDMVIVNKAIGGDEKAYAELLHKYQDSIFFLLYRRVGNEVDAEDLTMETFGKAFNNLENYTPNYAFSTWLFKIAINNCIDFFRKRQVRPQIQKSLDKHSETELANYSSNDFSSEEMMIRKEKSQVLKELIKSLKPRYAQLLTYRYYNEMSYEEISQEMQLPIGTVKAQLYRAKELLAPLVNNNKNL